MTETQGTSPRILMIEVDNEVRSLLKQRLCNHGYRVTIAFDEEDAVERSRSDRNCPRIILINQVEITPDASLNMGRRVCHVANLPAQTLIVVMADKYPLDMEGRDVKVSDREYVTYLEDGDQLINLLHQLCPV